VEPHISCIRSISVIRREAKMDEESIGNLLRIGASVLICIHQDGNYNDFHLGC